MIINYNSYLCNKVNDMDKVLNVHSVNDYARYQGAEVLHPYVSVIHYDELEHFRHSLNRYDVYGIFLADEVTEGLTYGMVNYDLAHHALMCVAPGQIGGKEDITLIKNYKKYESVTQKQFDKVNRTTSADDALKAAGITISMDNVTIEGGGDKDDFMKSLKVVSPYNPIEIAE